MQEAAGGAGQEAAGGVRRDRRLLAERGEAGQEAAAGVISLLYSRLCLLTCDAARPPMYKN